MKSYLVLAVDPGLLGGRPVADVLLLEPQLALVVRALHSVAAVYYVTSNLENSRCDLLISKSWFIEKNSSSSDELLLEPQLDLVVSALHSVTAVDNIASNLKQITIDDASLLI